VSPNRSRLSLSLRIKKTEKVKGSDSNIASALSPVFTEYVNERRNRAINYNQITKQHEVAANRALKVDHTQKQRDHTTSFIVENQMDTDSIIISSDEIRSDRMR